MKKRNLTQNQIEDLFTFCEEQNVKHYDLQIELVDHLANAIEQKWIEQPSLTYENALWAVYDEFGASGFRKIITSKEKMLDRKYSRICRKYFFEFFKLPKILLTLAATSILLFIFQTTHFNAIFNFVLLVLFILASFGFLVFYFPKKTKLNVEDGKTFMLLEQFKICHRQIVYLTVFPTLNVYLWGQILMRKIELPTHEMIFLQLIVALIYVLFAMMIIVFGFYLPRRIKDDFIQEYPQFVKS